MNYQADGGGGAGDVHMLYDEVRRIAQHTVGQMMDSATTDHTRFNNVKLSSGAFGDVPLAQDFHDQQAAAHHVFVETIKGVLDDLTTFQDNLLACAHGHQSNDEAIEAAMTALGHRYSSTHHTFQTAADNLKARHDKRLKVKGAQPAPQTLENTSNPDPQAPANQTTTSTHGMS